MRVLVLSDPHYAGPAEQERRDYEVRAIRSRVLRAVARTYRHYVWLRDPFAHNHLLDRLCQQAGAADVVIANGDYSCDSAFVGVSDAAAYQSADLCLARLRQEFGPRFRGIIGDHELGKWSLFGGQGGLRLASWERATRGLALEPFWHQRLGSFRLVGMTSTLLAFPVFEPEALPAERADWWALRERHLAEIRGWFDSVSSGERLLLFLHDPTAMPYLAELPEVRARLPQVEMTIIGHLHSPWVLWKSRILAGMPSIPFLGNTVRRLSEALRRAGDWQPFRVRLCPSLAGIQFTRGGGYLELTSGSEARDPLTLRVHSLPW